MPPIPLQAYVEYAFRRVDVLDPSVPSRSDQHGVATGLDFLWSPRVFGGLRFDYHRVSDAGRIADGTGMSALGDAYGGSTYISGFVVPPFFGGGVSAGFERGIAKTRLGDGRDRADRVWRYFVAPFLALAYPVGSVEFGAQPRVTFGWEELRFRRDAANNRDNADVDAALRLSAEWQVTQRLALSAAATPTWVLAAPHAANLPARDRFAVTFEGAARVWLSDRVALSVRYDYRAFDSSFRAQSAIVTLSYSLVPRLPIVIPARDLARLSGR